MGLDQLSLSPAIIEELYRNSLVDLAGKTVPEIVPGAPGLACLGNNQKRVLVLVNEPDAVYLADNNLNFLLGILTACQLGMDDIALVNQYHQPKLTHVQINEALSPEKVLFFGVEPGSVELPLQFPHYQVQHYNNQVYLSAPDLDRLAGDKSEKMKLWTCLKKIFLNG